MPAKKTKRKTRKRTIKSVSPSPSIEEPEVKKAAKTKTKKSSSIQPPKSKRGKKNVKTTVESEDDIDILSPSLPAAKKKKVNVKSPSLQPKSKKNAKKKAKTTVESEDDIDIDHVSERSSSFSDLDIDWSDNEVEHKVDGSENSEFQPRLQGIEYVQTEIENLNAWKCAKNTSVVVRVMCISALSYRNNKTSLKMLVADGNGDRNFIRLEAFDNMAAELCVMTQGCALTLRGVDIINNENEYENVPHSAVIFTRPNTIIEKMAESKVTIPRVVLPTLTSLSDIGNNMRDGQIISVVAHCRQSNGLMEKTRNGKDFRSISIMNHKRQIECRLYAKNATKMTVPENVVNKAVLLPFVRVNKFNGFQLTVSEDFVILDTKNLSETQLQDQSIRNVLKVGKMSGKKVELYEKLVKGTEKLTVANYKINWSSVCEKPFFTVMSDFQEAFRQQKPLQYETVKCEAFVMGLVDVNKVSAEWYTVPKDQSKGRKGLEFKGKGKWMSKQTREEFSDEEVMRKWCLKLRFNGAPSGFGTKMTLFDEAGNALFDISADGAYTMKKSNIDMYRQRMESVKGKKVMLCLQMTKKKNLKSYGKSWYSMNVQNIHVDETNQMEEDDW